MTINLRKTAELLKATNTELTVHLDELPGEETFLSVYLGEEDYVDVAAGEKGAEFWYEGSKRQDVEVANEEALIVAITEWFKQD